MSKLSQKIAAEAQVEKKNLKNSGGAKEVKKYKPFTLEETKGIIRKWLVMEDKDVFEILCSFVISEKVRGDPLWLFLIAPPGGGKTELLRAIDGQEYYHLSDLTSKTFISGLMVGDGDERRKIDDLLPQLDGKVLLFKDFTTILEKNKEERREIISQFRETYDGSFSKKFGSLDQKVEYRSRFGFVAGVTPIIDKHWKVMQQLGERCLKYRWDEDSDATTKRARENEGKEVEMRQEMKEAIMGFITNIHIINAPLPECFNKPLEDVAKFLALCRTPITIHSGSTDFYFDFIPTPESPTRLVKQLSKLAKCLACVRGHEVVEKDDAATSISVALHTAPQDRLNVLRAIEEFQGSTLEGCTIAQIMKKVKLPETSLRNICEQLRILDLIRVTAVTREAGYGKETTIYYELTEKSLALYPLTFLEHLNKLPLGAQDHSELENQVFFVGDCGLPGCPKQDFIAKYGQKALDKLIEQGQVMENPTGVLRVVE